MSANNSNTAKLAIAKINNAIEANQGRLDVLEVMAIVDNDGSFLNFLAQKIATIEEQCKNASKKSAPKAKDNLLGACRKLNQQQPNFQNIFDQLNQVLLFLPPDAKYLPSVYRLQAFVIEVLFKSKPNPRTYVDYADELDPQQNDDVLFMEFGLQLVPFRKFAETLDRLRDHDVPQARPNDQAFFISSSMEVRFSEERGQHFVATKDIAANELLLSEKVFATSVPAEKALQACSGCFASSTLPFVFPCDTCCQVTFCSLPCKARACSPEGVHARECGRKKVFAEFADLDDNENFMLNYNVLSRFDPNVFVSGELDNDAPYTAFEYAADQQRAPADEGEAKMRQLRLLKYILTMAFYSGEVPKDEFVDYLLGSMEIALLWLIQYKRTENFSREQKLLLINVCFQGLLRLEVNVFDFSSNFDLYTCVSPGLVLFASRYNHSCENNAIWHDFDGLFNYMTVKGIKKGDVIAINYYEGHESTTANFDERQADLIENYNLHCDCSACMVHVYSTQRPLLTCDSCQGPVYFGSSDHPICFRCRRRRRRRRQGDQGYTKEHFTEAWNMLSELVEQCNRPQEHQLASGEDVTVITRKFDQLSKILYHGCKLYQQLLHSVGKVYARQASMELRLLEIANQVIRIIPLSLKTPDGDDVQGNSIPVAAMKDIYKTNYISNVQQFTFWIDAIKELAEKQSLSSEMRSFAHDILGHLKERYRVFLQFMADPEAKDKEKKEDMGKTLLEMVNKFPNLNL